jgi:hypothetical protein
MEFYKKVHPDLFVANEHHRRVNQDSLASLNNILDYAATLKTNPYARPPAAQTLSFFCLPTLDRDSTAEPPKPKLVQVQFDPISGRDVYPNLDRCLHKLFRESGIDVPTQQPSEASSSKQQTSDRQTRRRAEARREREGAGAAEELRQDREIIFGRKEHKPRRMSEPRFCLIPAMMASGMIQYSSKLAGWQNARCVETH